ncbi:hypothetical protein ACNKHW_18575 [Shigella flexneri]
MIFTGYSVVLAFALVAMFKYEHVRVPTGTRRVTPNYAKKNGGQKVTRFFYSYSTHQHVQPFSAIRIGFAINTLQLRRKSQGNKFTPSSSARK